MNYLNISSNINYYIIINVRSVVTVKRKRNELNMKLKFVITHMHPGIGWHIVGSDLL